MLKLIVGLGNPGPKYEGTRHNVGFDVVDGLKQQITTVACQSKFKAEVCEAQTPHKFFVLIPQVFMNESGKPVGEFARFYKITPEETLVIYDDLDLPLGHLRLSEGGSAGGHKGVQSVIDNFGANFWRLRLGIGDNRAAGLEAEAYVLQKFKPEERKILEESVASSIEILKVLMGNEVNEAKQLIAGHNNSLQ